MTRERFRRAHVAVAGMPYLAASVVGVGVNTDGSEPLRRIRSPRQPVRPHCKGIRVGPSLRNCVFALAVLAAASVQPAGAITRTVSLTWTAPGDDGWIGRAKSYDIRFSRYPITSANFAYASRLNLALVPGLARATDGVSIVGLL